MLEGVRLKITRAGQHLKTLQRQLETFCERDPYSVASYVDGNTGEQVFYVDEEPKVVPPRLSITIGDAVYNLRSALDHLAWQLVIRNGATPTTRTAWPIYDRDTLFVSQGKPKLHGMSFAMQTEIKGLQPCYGTNADWNRSLSSLESLSNIDKHRHLNLIVASVRGGAHNIGIQLGVAATTEWVTFYIGPVEKGTILARFPAPYMNVEFEPSAGVFFAEAGPAYGRDVLMVLLEIREVISAIVTSFDRKFF